MRRKRLISGFVVVAVLAGIALADRLTAQEVPGPRPMPMRRTMDEYPPFEQVTEGFEPSHGFFTVYRKKNQVLLEVPEYQMGRAFLLATSVAGGSTLAGHQVDDIPAAF